MHKPSKQAAVLAVCALITVSVATESLFHPNGDETPEQADTLRVGTSAANTGGIYVVAHAVTGDDYDVAIPRPSQPTANSGG